MTPGRLRLDIDTTRDRLLALGCSYAAEHLDHLLTEAVGEAMAPHAFLDRLLEVEQSGREGRRVKTSLKMSGLPIGQTLENFDFAFQPAIERSRIDTLATGAWIRNAETVLMQGPPGVGKTQVSIATPGLMPRGRRGSLRLRLGDRGSDPVPGMPGTGSKVPTRTRPVRVRRP